MTNHRLEAESESYTVGAKATLQATVTRGAESWQFFAFVFAALVTLALTLLDELPPEPSWLPWRIGAKTGVFLGLAYLTLVNVSVRNWLVRLLGVFKEERHQ